MRRVPAPAASARKRVARAAPARAASARKGPARSVAAESPEKLLRRLQSARRRLERQLTAAVQEIGLLRQFEMRTAALEAEVARRDAEIERLRGELEARLGGASLASQIPGA